MGSGSTGGKAAAFPAAMGMFALSVKQETGSVEVAVGSREHGVLAKLWVSSSPKS